MFKNLSLSLVFALIAGATALAAAPAERKPNILFIAVDDLRPQLGCYGVDWMKTPNIDSLAERGVRFERHYVQFAVCIPSRVALLTSLRSERTHQVYGPHVWQQIPDVSTLGRTFGDAGYATISLGKIWHGKPEGGTRKDGDVFDEVWVPKVPSYAGEIKNSGGKSKGDEEGGEAGPVSEALDVPDSTYEDGQIALAAIDRLKKLTSDKNKPFLLAVGFHRPHLPFVAPKKYWDLYDREKLPLPPQPNFPEKAPGLARNHGIKGFIDIAHGPDANYDEATVRRLIHGYCASTSYVDSQVGLVLEALRASGQENNTIVVLWGDHGWQLGDLDQWAKSTNYERATRSPLIVCAPGKASGAVSSNLVETVDIFPSLVDLAGLPALPLTDGRSFAPLLVDSQQPWKQAVYHVFDRMVKVPGSTNRLVIGYAVRTENARYVEWHEGWSRESPIVAREFYRYTATRPDEVVNEVEDPALRDLVAAHARLLRENAGYRADNGESAATPTSDKKKKRTKDTE